MEVTREQLEHYRPLNLNLTLANGEEDILKVTDIVYSGLKLEPHNKSKTLNIDLFIVNYLRLSIFSSIRFMSSFNS